MAGLSITQSQQKISVLKGINDPILIVNCQLLIVNYT
jgi:hypothetical protein